MRLNWNAIGQTIVIALLIAVGTRVWQTYEATARLPALEGEIRALRGSLLLQDEKLSALRVAIAVLDERSRREARAQGRHYTRAE